MRPFPMLLLPRISPKRKKLEDQLDAELEATFPASDPPSLTAPAHTAQELKEFPG